MIESFLEHIENLLDNLTLEQLRALTILSILIVGTVDYITGFELSFSLFYLLPVSIASRREPLAGGLLVALTSSLIWVSSDILGGKTFSSWAIPFWNFVVRFGVQLLFFSVLTRLRHTLANEKQLARSDHLTGAANTRAFYQDAEVLLQQARRHGWPVSIAFLDLDDFKEINDAYGHKRGDLLLKMMVEILQANLRTSDLLARVGGDEFVILLPNTHLETAREVITRLHALLNEQFRANQYLVTTSIGVTTFLTPPDSIDVLIGEADTLMYRVKEEGKNSVSFQMLD